MFFFPFPNLSQIFPSLTTQLHVCVCVCVCVLLIIGLPWSVVDMLSDT